MASGTAASDTQSAQDDLTDVRNAVCIFLQAVTQTGCLRNNGGYDHRSLTPVEFAYPEHGVQDAIEFDPWRLEKPSRRPRRRRLSMDGYSRRRHFPHLRRAGGRPVLRRRPRQCADTTDDVFILHVSGAVRPHAGARRSPSTR